MDWDRVHAGFGWRLPSDYRDYVAAYGMGTINETLSIVTPPPSDYPYVHHLLCGCTYPPADGPAGVRQSAPSIGVLPAHGSRPAVGVGDQACGNCGHDGCQG